MNYNSEKISRKCDRGTMTIKKPWLCYRKIDQRRHGCNLEPGALLFICSVMSNSLQPHGLQHVRLPCPSLSPRVCSNSCPLSWLWAITHP